MYEYLNVMLISPNEIKGTNYTNSNLDDALLGATIRNAQSVYLKEVIGKALLERLQSLVYGKITESGASIDDEEFAIYKELLDIYVSPYLAAKTQALLTVPVSFKLRNMGVVQDSDTNVASVGMSTVKELNRWFETEVAHCATDISFFLCQHKSEFEELNGCDSCCCGNDMPRLGYRYNPVPLNLGIKGNNCCR